MAAKASAEVKAVDGNAAFKVIAGSFDFHKSYARRRPDEPKSHYNARVRFIQALLKEEGHVLTDEKVEVLSHCFSNVKYLNNKYPPDIMAFIEKYDPTLDRSKTGKTEGKAGEAGEAGEAGTQAGAAGSAAASPEKEMSAPEAMPDAEVSSPSVNGTPGASKRKNDVEEEGGTGKEEPKTKKQKIQSKPKAAKGKAKGKAKAGAAAAALAMAADSDSD